MRKTEFLLKQEILICFEIIIYKITNLISLKILFNLRIWPLSNIVPSAYVELRHGKVTHVEKTIYIWLKIHHQSHDEETISTVIYVTKIDV